MESRIRVDYHNGILLCVRRRGKIVQRHPVAMGHNSQLLSPFHSIRVWWKVRERNRELRPTHNGAQPLPRSNSREGQLTLYDRQRVGKNFQPLSSVYLMQCVMCNLLQRVNGKIISEIIIYQTIIIKGRQLCPAGREGAGLLTGETTRQQDKHRAYNNFDEE